MPRSNSSGIFAIVTLASGIVDAIFAEEYREGRLLNLDRTNLYALRGVTRSPKQFLIRARRRSSDSGRSCGICPICSFQARMLFNPSGNSLFWFAIGFFSICALGIIALRVGHRGEIMTVRRSLSLPRANDCFGLRLDGLSLRLS
jgi:hypothetical protein